MNHYCTYFDRGFLIQGLVLWRSLEKHDETAVLWVLALDDVTAEVLRKLAEPRLRIVDLAEVERGNSALATAKANRSRVEYYFTLSPCWPGWLLAAHPEIDRVTYLDADLFFFAAPSPIFTAMDAAGASVLITAHRFPAWLAHYERHGRFNVGILSFRNDEVGRACLADWRASCIEWCHDRLEGDRYADQKYLDAWPAKWGARLLVIEHPGVNLAPWNWSGHRVEGDTIAILVDGQPLILFHFARLRPIRGDWWWQSGQLDYGVMPRRMRNVVYGSYWAALKAARRELRAVRPEIDFARRAPRFDRSFWRGLPLRVLFGSDWLQVGGRFYSGRLGFGRWSGQCLRKLRKVFLG